MKSIKNQHSQLRKNQTGGPNSDAVGPSVDLSPLRRTTQCGEAAGYRSPRSGRLTLYRFSLRSSVERSMPRI